jgi:putative copper resistance protein D
MFEAGLIASRFLHYMSSMALVGVSLFLLYAYPRRRRPANPFRRLQSVLFVAAIAALVSGILWVMFAIGDMSGSLAVAVDRDTLWALLQETDFGRIWAARLGLSIVILGLTGFLVRRTAPRLRELLTAFLAAALLATLAGVGHTHVNDGIAGVIHMGADAAHLLAAGAWLGGLLCLGFILAAVGPSSRSPKPGEIYRVLQRFSGMGYVAVAVLVGSGLINSWFLVGSFSGLIETSYGQVLLAKIGLFSAMVALAAFNRFWLVPSLARACETEQAAVWTIRLRRHVVGEQALGTLIVLIVSVLGTLRPAISDL